MAKRKKPESQYSGEFSDWNDVTSNFNCTEPEPDLVWATYDTPPYEGYATVVYRKGKEWFLVEGSHCSYYGLEDQWKPEGFNPADHLLALSQGKRLISVYQGQQEAFDDWLRKAA